MNHKIRLHKQITDNLKQLDELDYTNPEIQRNIENYGVYVDGVLVNNRLSWVYLENTLDIHHWPKRQSGNFDEVKILSETEDYLAIYKPMGVVVESGAGHQKDNLLNWLETQYKSSFFLIHRLDKDTQGVMLIAKNEKTLNFYQDQFRNREVVKKYFAVVGKPVDNLWTIENWQSRDRSNPLRQKLFWSETKAMEYDSNSRLAKSVIRPRIICQATGQSLIEVEIKTGRMHQIRLQCEALGFGLVNDRVYNQMIKPTELNQSTTHIIPNYSIINKNLQEFEYIKKVIFGQTEYCLLSNYLKVKTPDNGWLEIEYRNLKDLLGTFES